MKIGKLAVVAAAAVMALTLLSGKAELSFQHHLNLPQDLTGQPKILVQRNLFSGNVTDIYLKQQLKSPDSVQDIIHVLSKADKNDTIILHIAGIGGRVDTAMRVINAIRETKGKVILKVEAPSYSGHAFIASSGGTLIMEPNTFLMFHTTSAYGHDCNDEIGTDRTVSNVEHCQAFMTAHLRLVNTFLDSITFLTPEEKELIKTGHDVYISADEYKARTDLYSLEHLNRILDKYLPSFV